MIRPQPKPGSAAPRGVAFLLTGALLFGAHLGLKGMAVPAFASSRAMIRELDPLMLERFVAAAPPEAAAAGDEAEAVEDVPEEAEIVPSFEEEVGTAMEELERRFSRDETVRPEVPREASGEAAAPGIAADAGEAAADRFESLFGVAGGVAVDRATRGRAGAATGPGGLGLGVTERSGAPESTGDGPAVDRAGPDVAVATAADRSHSVGEDVEIREFRPESFDGSEADLLALWLRQNRSDLPVGVRVHVNFQPSFLTAAVPFSSEGREWDLYLMFNETLRELHIVLIEDDRSVYLIDRGFQEQSRSLREGTVRRDGERIVAIDSRTGAASSDRAQEFYNVFLSWWESARNDVETP